MPSTVEKDIQSRTGSSVRKPSLAVHSYEKMKGKKLHFPSEEVVVPESPLSRFAAKKFPLEQTFEAMETIQKDYIIDDKDKDIS